MNTIQVYRIIKDMAKKKDSTSVPINELATKANMSRIDLISFLVDLSMAGLIDMDRENVTLAQIQKG